MSASPTPWTRARGAGARRADSSGGCGRVQLARLFRLVLLLQAERFPNARELAERCEVSRRTVYRDLDLLAGAGIPVRYRQEREGYQLGRGFFLPPTGVDEAEALALLVLARQWKGGDGLGLLRHAWGGAVKLVQSLAPEVRERVLAAVEPFEAPADASTALPADRQAVHDTILTALSRLRQMRVWYRDAATLDDACTKFSLYRLLLHDRHWFMVGRSTLHRKVEVIGVPWVERVVLTDDPYEIPPRFRLVRHLAQAWGVCRDRVRYRVWLRFGPGVAPELNDTRWHPSERKVELGDGRVDVHYVVDGLDEILRWVLGFGDQVEVLAPPELRSKLFGTAVALARRHRPTGRATPPVDGPAPP